MIGKIGKFGGKNPLAQGSTQTGIKKETGAASWPMNGRLGAKITPFHFRAECGLDSQGSRTIAEICFLLFPCVGKVRPPDYATFSAPHAVPPLWKARVAQR